MAEKYFHFKQFKVAHDHCAMKVGTDGVLLGMWCSLDIQPGINCRVLDVGTGSGVIGLILAQRYPTAHITGLEIEANAAHQAAQNFKESPWPDRLEVINGSFQKLNFASDNPVKYDHIISNPPFFADEHHSTPSGNERREARNDISLTIEDLILHTSRWLTDRGKLSLILPYGDLLKVHALAEQAELYLLRKTKVVPITGKPPHRILLEFRLRRNAGENRPYIVQEDLLILQRSPVRNDFTDAYKKLAKEFYTIL